LKKRSESLLQRFEVQHNRVHAEAFSGGWRAIVEQVAQVGAASSTLYLNAFHAMGIIGQITDSPRASGFEETGPATGTGKFGI
jgi:hypothetical protein